MKALTAASKLILQTPNHMSSGGGSFEKITASDLGAVLGSIDCTPLIRAFFEVKYLQHRLPSKHIWMYTKIKAIIDGRTDKFVGMGLKERVYQIVQDDTMRRDFKKKLAFWIHNRLLNQKHLTPTYISKNHISAVNAAHELSDGLADYLARHKIKDESLSPWFNQPHQNHRINKDMFNRKYATFIRDCISDLENDLRKLEFKIHERTKND